MKNIFIILIATTVMSCSQTKVDTKSEGEKLMQLSKEWSEAASSGDLEKTVSYWADDAYMLSPGETPLKGKQAIREMVEGAFKSPGFHISWEPNSVEVSESGDMTYLLEDVKTSYTDSTGTVVTMDSKAVTIWRKQADGSWKNVVDVSIPQDSH